MLQIIQKNRIYFILLLLYFSIAGVILPCINQGDTVLFFNKNHNVLFDNFFYFITYIGDGWILIPLLLFTLLFLSFYESIVLLSSILGTFVIIQFLKKIIFFEALRPAAYFGDSVKLHFVEGLQIHTHHSFPSGHSGQAFAISVTFALLLKNKNWNLLLFLLALLASLSRVYLSQHFLIDTYIGALIATIISIFTYSIFETQTSLSRKPALQQNFLTLYKK